MPKSSELYLFVPDAHFKETHKPTLRALLDFLEHNKIDGYIWGGDQMDNTCISHHTKGKPLLRDRAAYKNEEKGFDTQVLKPVESNLDKDTKRIWIQGNHDFWEEQLVESHPEFDGLQRQYSLDLEARGWEFIPCGEAFRHGKLTFIHGETLTGIGNQASMYHAKKAVESYCSSVVYAHLHSPQSFTKVLPHDDTEKWMAYCSPILGEVNPNYLRNRPTAWLNGWTIVEFHPDGSGNFNVYPCIVSNGKMVFGGKTYGK